MLSLNVCFNSKLNQMNKRESYQSTCSYCGVGCGIKVYKDRNSRVIVEGDREHPANKGMLCSKGMNLHYTVSDTSDRLLYPHMRGNRDQPLRRVSWDTAIGRAAAVFKSLINKYGPDSVGFYVSGQCLTEEYYLVNKLTKGFLGTNNIDTNSRLCMSSAVAAYKMALGEDAVPVSYEDIELADCFFITGANPAWCHPILFRRIEAHKAANPHIKIIVADPRKTQSAQMADLHLPIKPGTDSILYHALGRYIIENNGIDHDFIRDHTEGFDTYARIVFERSLEEAADLCGISLDDLTLAGKYICQSSGFLTMWAMGLNQSSVGVNKNLALINLSLITGKIGKPGCGPFSLTGQPNAMGGREVGGMANLLPAHRNLADPLHRKEVADFWGVPSLPEKPGYTATEQFDALLSGRMKAIWIICTNPLVSLPDARNVEIALKNAKFVVVQDISGKSDTLQYADLVLPAAGWLEKEGTMTNSDRRITLLEKALEPPGEALPDMEILRRFAVEMGFGEHFDYQDAEQVFLEHAALTKNTRIDISGLDYSILKKRRAVQWPFPEHAESDTPRLFTDHLFYTADKKARIHPVSDQHQSEKVSEAYPLILTTGRIRDQWHTMTRTGKVRKLQQHIDKPFLEIHEEDAAIRSLNHGDIAEIYNDRGIVKVVVQITNEIRPGVVFLPMHWGKTLNKDFSRTNNLTAPIIDPVSKEPDFKYSAVNVRRFNKRSERIIVVGAGAASYRLVHRYRELNAQDSIKVFSREKHHFYNRVMLPDYISGHMSWSQLVKATDEEMENLGIVLNAGVGIESVDRSGKFVTDTNGNIHPYDKLILATGSRANMPASVATSLDGIFTMRQKEDADRLMELVHGGMEAIVVGGGLLGLELADSLTALDVNVTVIQRSSRLMDRQLDPVASELLYEELNYRGIKVYFNDELLSISGKGRVSGVRLKGGKYIKCQLVVFAIGTIPNIELARASGLKCNRGVVVNDYLQTSDPDVFSIGEIAEHGGNLYGITAAAEQQAEILAEYLNGNESSFYTGSLSMNILKVRGLDLCSLGVVTYPEQDPGYEVITLLDRNAGYYKKCILHQDRMVGAILYGDKSEFQEYKELISKGIELADRRHKLLRPGQSVARQVSGRLVCSCNNVGQGNIEEAIENGCTDLRSICEKTGAGTGCGSCRPEVKKIMETVSRQEVQKVN